MLILWFRNDLRLEDNQAFYYAIKEGLPLCPLYVFSPNNTTAYPMGSASKWWLHFALKDLRSQLAKYHLELIVRTGPPREIIKNIAIQTGAKAVFWSEGYEPESIKDHAVIQKELTSQGIKVNSFKSYVLFDPSKVRNKSGNPFQVFTPFWRHCLSLNHQAILYRPDYKNIVVPTKWPHSETIEGLNLLPQINWDTGLADTWDPTVTAANKRLTHFVKKSLSNYQTDRDHPGIDGTSCLSAYLHFGQLSPNQVWHAVTLSEEAKHKGGETFLSEIGWREFAYHLLYHFPETPFNPLKKDFKHFPWRRNNKSLQAWQLGETGYPIVDAGMRQLWQIGWMHNRVRMVVGSFLVKHLLQPWQEGAAWFWDTLVDADLASNTLGWQWVSGCGADAAPYFRVFNPVLQGEKFDPEGIYVKCYLPELGKLPKKWIHKPWEAPKTVLEQAGVVLGKNYPTPIIGLDEGRSRALKAYEHFKATCGRG